MLATDENGQPMLAIRSLGDGRIVNFAMELSGSGDYPGLTDPGVQRLLLNCANW
jgi:hypothetical protein